MGLTIAACVRRARARRAPAQLDPTSTIKETAMEHPRVVARAEWLRARQALLALEKTSSRERDRLAAARRNLPMVELEKSYVFTGPTGAVTLLELFEGRSQLIVYHFMFDPAWEEGCRSCSHMADNYAGSIAHLGARDTAFAAVSRAPIEKLQAFKSRMGWTFTWVSSGANEFNVDYGVTIDVDGVEGSEQHNYERADTLFCAGKIWFRKGELPGLSVFLRQDDRVFHTYSAYQRGLDVFLNTYNLLDITPLGRQEADGRIQAWIKHHDRYSITGA
jgi:predicted dithiol-disulfide oxidoreductase (DUF899 family)